jgi:sortase A
VRKKASLDDLSVEELRRLLVEKRRSARQERITRFRQTGRVITLVSDADAYSLDNLRSSPSADEEDEAGGSTLKLRLRRFFDGLLLAAEVSAVIGLVFVIFNGLEMMRDLNRQVAEVLELPTPTPTAPITAVVLPSGHTPPDASGRTMPNDAEIPEHLRPLVASLASLPIPTPAPEHARQIQIPAINVNANVVQGDGPEQLKKGVGQHIGTANPGDKGNMVLTAHNDVFGEIFRYLDRLQPGDEVIVQTSQKSYTYIVTGTRIVEPTQVEVMGPTLDATATLISCYPYMVDNKRIVVTAKLASSSR